MSEWKLWNRLFRRKKPVQPHALEGKAKDVYLRDFMLKQIDAHWNTVRHEGNVAIVSCPFHDESFPTLSIALTAAAGRKQGVFYCFGCAEQGSWAALAKKVGMETLPVEPDAPAELKPMFNESLGRARARGQHLGRAHRPGHRPTAQTHYFDVRPSDDWDRSSPSRQDNSSLNLANAALMGAVLSDSDTRRESCAAPHAPSSPTYDEPTRSYAPDPTPSSSYDGSSSDGGGGGGGCD